MSNPYRNIPSVNELVDDPALTPWTHRMPRSLVVRAARLVLDEHRQSLAASRGGAQTPPNGELARRVVGRLEAMSRPPLTAAINATGIIIHTGLGRAPLAGEAVEALRDVAGQYAPVELDLDSGERGRRTNLVRDLLCELTGAESATVVNNNAAALMIILSTFATGKNVIVSRGELIESGGSFRLPDIMRASGAFLREVGTTNRTRLSDYQAAIDDDTAAVMSVHTSNYRVEGFTTSPPFEELAGLAQRHGVPIIHDTGSGVLSHEPFAGMDDPTREAFAREPAARAAIEAGADLVLFSGDKLLGGPQAGIIVGRADLVAAMEKNPMMRAMRVDKLILASLGATLQLHRDPDLAAEKIPVLAMASASVESLLQRARRLVAQMSEMVGVVHVEACETEAYLGGGSLPAQAIRSAAVVIEPAGMSEEELARRLRTGSPGVVARREDGRVWLDLRTVRAWQDAALVECVRQAVSG